MRNENVLNYIKTILVSMPVEWLNLTTHRLDIYNENLAKAQFTEEFESLYQQNDSTTSALKSLPTAYDYIRLGHPLSCILEWTIAGTHNIDAENVITFSSKTAPIMAVLRTNLLAKKNTQIVFTEELPNSFNTETLRNIYGYKFNLKQVKTADEITEFDGSTIFIDYNQQIGDINLSQNIDFSINANSQLGSILIVNGDKNKEYISDIQHVRRRETIAMTPANCHIALGLLTGQPSKEPSEKSSIDRSKELVVKSIKDITGTTTEPLVGSSGLSVQYAIMMGLIHDSLERHPGKVIKFIVPPNCYGGTNDQARRVAACVDLVEIVDLPVDGENDMAQSIDTVLDEVAAQDAIAYIIVEIPTNPRVEVPHLNDLKAVLCKKRSTPDGKDFTEPVFIVDQTFCPNVRFLGDNDILSCVNAISYVSGSKFPSGGKCTAGYCVANRHAAPFMQKIESHLLLCDNQATDLQIQILSDQLPSMNYRIEEAYKKTRDFVNFIEETLPSAKINFVSDELAALGFTPSVFSLDLPTKGKTEQEKETYKRELNLKLINLMITEIPSESKYCVSYGQLKGCYWTIPATSTQGTTKEGDKDYIARVALSPSMDLDLHKKVFSDFVKML